MSRCSPLNCYDRWEQIVKPPSAPHALAKRFGLDWFGLAQPQPIRVKLDQLKLHWLGFSWNSTNMLRIS